MNKLESEIEYLLNGESSKVEETNVWLGEDKTVLVCKIRFYYDSNWMSESAIETAQEECGKLLSNLLIKELNKIHHD